VYSPGDQASAIDTSDGQSKIYECKNWPYDGNCGQLGFKPGQNDVGTHIAAWTFAWTEVGPCSGSPVSDMSL